MDSRGAHKIWRDGGGFFTGARYRCYAGTTLDCTIVHMMRNIYIYKLTYAFYLFTLFIENIL